MDCICNRTCTIRRKGKSIFVQKGQILDLPECPEYHFEAIGEVVIDFETASLELLLKSKEWKTSDAIRYLKATYSFEPGGLETRREIARIVVDKRMRRVTLPNEVG